MHYPLISNNFLEGFVDLLKESNVDPGPLFIEEGFDANLLRHSDTLIPFDSHNNLLMKAAKKIACPHIGLELARRQGLSIFGPLATMTTTCKTVGEALTMFSNHIALVVQTVELRLVQQGDLVHFIITSDFKQVAATTTFQDHALALAYDLIKVFCGQQWLPRAAYLPHDPPKEVRPYTDFFHCPIGFNNAQLALVFDANILLRPVDRDAGQLPQKLRQYLEDRHQDDLLKQVKHVIALTLASDECSLKSVAHAIGYSKRTLQRRLNELGTSFQAVVDSVRYIQATSYLEHPYYRLTDISAMLGYSELSAFTRSFKRWFGVSPQTRRKQSRMAAANR